MCVVIDTCTFSKVFNEDDKNHDHFAPILKWITKKNGKIIIGGSKYAKEVLERGAALDLLTELERKNRLVKLDDKEVDDYAAALKKKAPEAKFNDEHIVAMVGISRCCVVCTDEKKAVPYLKRKDFYPAGVKPPSIYRNENHARLCCPRHIVGKCRDR